ncbi:MAG: serine/threonine protein kinase [Leptolyngbya sp. LCM1.Bin17]|nr:MAG: serine/threonine protein kinase [Leptolyngbya sp. LCM1.Bin17]
MVSLPWQIRRSHYRLLGLVGHGQFGRVYCAVHRTTGELVAIKDLHKDRFPTHKFLRELRFLLSLEHPNIVTCHALEHSDSGRQLVLDYCEGGTLRSLMESDTPVSLAEIIGFVVDILGALDQAHHHGIVHCDIKPENILLQLTPGGWVTRISDFGIARLSQEAKAADLGQTGSPAYMAPERFYNQHPAASDLYAVGVILYELVVGHRPFLGTPMELMVAHLNQRPTLPSSVPEPMQQVILKALQKLLPKRFKTARDMQRELWQVSQQLRQGTLENTPFPPRSLPPTVIAPPLAPVVLPHPVTVIGLVALDQHTQLLIACHQHHVWFYHWPQGETHVPGPTQGFALPHPIRQFIPLPQGGMLATNSSLHLLSMAHGLGRVIDSPETTVAAAVAPSGRWVTTYPSQPGEGSRNLLIYRLTMAMGQPVTVGAPRAVTLPDLAGTFVDLLALDDRHVMVVMRQGQSTQIHITSRRGTYLGSKVVQVPCDRLVATARPYRYLALEVDQPQSVLVLDVKPFRMVRYRLPIHPQWLFETAVGYGLLSSEGEFCLLNDEGQVLNRLDGLPCPTAMVSMSPTQYLWSLSTDQGSQLCTFDLAKMDLDLLF